MLTHAPILIIAIPLLAAFAIPLIGKISSKLRNWFALLALLLTVALVCYLAADIFANGLRIYTLGAKSPALTLPSGYQVPVRIILEVDAMSIFMALISSFIALMGVIYSFAFMKGRGGLSKFYSLLLLLTAGMFGMEFTGDAFNLFVFLEVTSIAACGLVGFNIKRGQSQEAAFKTMVLYTVGALLFLFAVGIFYGQYNALNFGYLAETIQYNLLDKIALALFVISLCMKAGAVPMHMWVPDAYAEAPSPISMILVSNTLASLYALYRICFSLYGLSLNFLTVGWLLAILGVLTIFIGVSMAFLQDKFKRLMAYCALSQVGYMLLGVGVGLAVLGNTEALNNYGFMAMKGGIFHILNDALYKGLLFLTAGAIIYRTGKRHMSEISGLARSMKWTAVFFIIGAGAISGLPPFNGFASKLMIYESVFKFNPILSVIAIIASILTLAVFAKVFHSAFLGPQLTKYETVREVPTSMMLAMAVLSILIVLFGIFPDLVVNHIVEPAARALVDQSKYILAIMEATGGM